MCPRNCPGLHFEDVRKFLEVLHALVEQGNTVVVIKHNLDVIKTADWVLDLGPGGGVNGGEIVAEGTPEKVVTVPGSFTGAYLKPLLERGAEQASPHASTSTPAKAGAQAPKRGRRKIQEADEDQPDLISAK